MFHSISSVTTKHRCHCIIHKPASKYSPLFSLDSPMVHSCKLIQIKAVLYQHQHTPYISHHLNHNRHITEDFSALTSVLLEQVFTYNEQKTILHTHFSAVSVYVIAILFLLPYPEQHITQVPVQSFSNSPLLLGHFTLDPAARNFSTTALKKPLQNFHY